jgi:hypothetical protein
LSTDESSDATSIRTVEPLEGPGAKAAEFTSRVTRRPGKLTEEGSSRITDTTTGFECKSNEATALEMTTRLPLAIYIDDDLRFLAFAA